MRHEPRRARDRVAVPRDHGTGSVMSLVNFETGELVEVMDPDAARRLTERIRIAATNYTEAKDKVLRLVDEAKAGLAHVALGYKSWTAYLSDVLSDEPLRLASDEQRELTERLADEGMSMRAIAPIVGVSKSTVQNWTVESAPQVREVEGLDGKRRTTTTAPRTPPRRALPDQFFDAFYELTKAVEKVERICADDRFPQNAEQVTAKHRSDLTRSIEALGRVLNQFNT